MFDTHPCSGNAGFQSVPVVADLQCMRKMDFSAVSSFSNASYKAFNKYRVK